MSFFSSEGHMEAWLRDHPELRGEQVTLEQALRYITAVGRDRRNFDYVHPVEAVNATLQEIGLTSEFWKR